MTTRAILRSFGAAAAGAATAAYLARRRPAPAAPVPPSRSSTSATPSPTTAARPSTAWAASTVATQAETVLDAVQDIVCIVDRAGVVRYVTPSLRRVLGWKPEQAIGVPVCDVIDPSERASMRAAFAELVAHPGRTTTLEVRVTTRAGASRMFEVTATNRLDDPAVHGVVLVGRDIDDRRRLEDTLAHQALHDALTGLPNRVLFLDRLHALLERRVREPHLRSAVLVVDVDDFAAVNESFGRAFGDELLAAVGERLRVAIRAGDTAARVGGDQFAVLLADLGAEGNLDEVATRLLDLLHEPYALRARDHAVRVSIGARPIADGDAGIDVVRDAGAALQAAKVGGKRRVEVFCESIALAASWTQTVRAELSGAWNRGEMYLAYQPIVDLATRQMFAVEALARWHHPDHGPIPPDEFIPQAELSGDIVELGEWVLRTACAAVGRWSAPIDLTVNVSALQLAQPDFAAMVLDVLTAERLAPRRLIIELTEGVMLVPTETVRTNIALLEAEGVRLAIDDFGTGYSSLSYLRQLPIDVVKIDRSFVLEIDRSATALALAKSIIAVTHALDMRAVAEGIETEAQLEVLRAAGCRYGQGYLFSVPLFEDQVTALVDSTLSVPVNASWSGALT